MCQNKRGMIYCTSPTNIGAVEFVLPAMKTDSANINALSDFWGILVGLRTLGWVEMHAKVPLELCWIWDSITCTIFC